VATQLERFDLLKNARGADMKDMKIAGFGMGAIVTAIGLILWSPIVGGFNFIGIVITLIGLIGFGGFAKGKWY
jgi:hypothetical protein